MHAVTDFARLMDEARRGSEDAAREIVRCFGDHVLLIVRRRLGRSLRRRHESADFTQNVWSSFFAHLHDLQGIETPEALAGFLTRMARNKVVSEVRRQLETAKRSVDREESLQTYQELPEHFVNSRSPSKLLMADEAWDRLMDSTSEQGRQILELRRRGMTLEEVAQHLDINERTVRRVLKRLQSVWGHEG